MVEKLVAMHVEKYKASGAELVMGEAKVLGDRTIEIRPNEGGTRTITGERVFLNLGTHASVPGISGLRECEPLTNIEVLELDRLPAHLIVIGGGYVGLEFAQAYRRFGSKVTVLQRSASLLVNEDLDVSSEIHRLLEAEGIEVVTSASVG